MITMLAGLLAPKLGEVWAPRIAKLVVWGLALAIIAFLLYRLVDNYGDRREGEGRDAERAAWVAAGEKLKQDAAKSATKADDAAAKRLTEHMEQSDAEKQAVDEAVANGTSPLDALFGG